MATFLKMIIEIDAQRPKVKLWFPGRIAKASKDGITDRAFKSMADPLAMGSAEDPVSFAVSDSSNSTLRDDDDSDDEFGSEKGLAEPPSKYVLDWDGVLNDFLTFPPIIFFQTEKRNPDAFPPKTASGKFLLRIAPFFQFLKSANGIFALRMGLVSVALWVPAVCHSSAWFYYDNKGLWALIMAQVCS